MKTKMFKNKIQMVIYIFIFILLIIGFIYFGGKDYSKSILLDNERFSQEYNMVPTDNVFSYVNVSEAKSLEKSNNVILFFGNENNPWVGYYAKILNDVAKKYGINKIYYYDLTSDRKNNNATYESIVEDLKKHVNMYDDGSIDIHCPALLVKKNGLIILYDDETSIIKANVKPEDYYDDLETEYKESILSSAFATFTGKVLYE